MPYIKQEDYSRASVDPETAGELNFKLTKACINYLEKNGLSYQNLNDCIGALEGAKAELQRRVVAPYEDAKIAENGDVYPPSLLTKTEE